jgi:hypothetical protein
MNIFLTYFFFTFLQPYLVPGSVSNYDSVTYSGSNHSWQQIRGHGIRLCKGKIKAKQKIQGKVCYLHLLISSVMTV